jgi:hypothetical protein
MFKVNEKNTEGHAWIHAAEVMSSQNRKICQDKNGTLPICCLTVPEDTESLLYMYE